MAVTAITLMLSSCASPEENVYAPEIAAAKSVAESDFEKTVFEDNLISRAEYEEAEQRYVACLDSKGAKISLVDEGGYYTYEISGEIVDTYDAVKDDCRLGNTNLIESLYVDQLLNPQKIAFEDKVVACFIANGVAPADFTAKDFLDIVADNPRGLATANEPGSQWAGYNFDPDSNPEALACVDE